MAEFLYPPTQSSIPMLGLLPSPEEAPHSSLSRMAGFAMEDRGTEDSCWGVRGGGVDFQRCRKWFETQASQSSPVLVMGTAFSWVHLLDEMRRIGMRIQLPPGSRLMETGGFKGRSREVPVEELHGMFAECLGVDASGIVNEYGMTELTSQFYAPARTIPRWPSLVRPPWTRWLCVRELSRFLRTGYRTSWHHRSR